MRKIILPIFVVSLFLVIVSVHAAEVSVSPSEFEVSLYAGDSYQKNITVLWKDQTDVVGHIVTEITQESGEFDGVGFNITYSENPLVLHPNTPKKVAMTITTLPNLVPGTYVISAQVGVEMERNIETKQPIIHYYSGAHKKAIDELNETLNKTLEKLNISEGKLNENMKKLNETEFLLNQTGIENQLLRGFIKEKLKNIEEDFLRKSRMKILMFFTFVILGMVLIIILRIINTVEKMRRLEHAKKKS